MDFLIATDVAARVSIKYNSKLKSVPINIKLICSCRDDGGAISLLYFVFQGLDIIGVQTVINFACPRDLTR